VLIGEKVRELRKLKSLSQGTIETRSGLLRCYLSRVENGHTVPSIETLEKIARAMEVPLYTLFYDEEEPSNIPAAAKLGTYSESAWSSSVKGATMLNQFRRAFSRVSDRNLKILFSMAQKMARPAHRGAFQRESASG
jgi:transcriptional regulator with XRE-family HTH domain